MICLWYIKTFGVDVPYWDEWSCVDLLKNFCDHTVGWLDILRMQSGEHMVGIPYLLMIGLAKYTHYNVRAEMFLGWFFLLLTWALLLKIARDRLPNGFPYVTALLPVSWLVCSLRQYETLLWGFQIQTPISIFFFVLSVYLLERTNTNKYWFLGLAMLSGLCSTLSFGNGLLIWPLGALQILLKTSWNERFGKSFKPIAIWLVAAAAVSLCFLYHYKCAYLAANPYGVTQTFWLHHSKTVICFFIAYLVSPLISTLNDSIANSYPDMIVSQGLAVLVLYIAAVGLAFREYKSLGNKLVAPIILILYAVLSDCLTLLARAGGGVNQALASRYTAISCLGIIGVYLLLLLIQKPSLKIRAFMLGALLVPVFTSMIMCTKVGVEEGKRIRVQRSLLSYVVLSYKQQDPKLFTSLKLPGDFKSLASFLESNHLSVFRKLHPNLHITKIHVD